MFLNSFLFSAGLLIAHTDTLQTVIVTADKGVVVSRTDTTMISPTQTVVDVLNNYSSLLLSDYGGLAGNKSVSFRGLGSAHTNIYVDGVKVGNVQSGQTDLGSLSFNTYSKLAVDYAQNSVYLTTSMPSSQKKVSGEVAFRGGTWNTYLPYARLNVRLSENVVSSYTAGGIFSKGNYSYGEAGIVRENNDMKQGQFGADFWGTLQNGTWHTKAYLNTSDRGVAGSTSWPSADRQNDKNMFLQGSLSNRFNSLYEFTSSAKLSYDYMRYESSYGENYYKQFEGQINTSHLFHFTKWFTLSASLDAFIDNLCSDNYNAFRTNLNTVITAAFRTQRLKANVSVDYLG
ncbi:MAG: TonB-dependent receptor plug domain-containing protein, partial [Bacteroidales bacterium]|nr:TonB-dependent receptor plug domain-containing protein [Bacteroidales bacterium]